MWRPTYIILISVFGQIPLGFILAYVLYRKLVRMTDLFQAGTRPGWENPLFTNPRTAMLPVLFVILWMYAGTYPIIFLANLQKSECYPCSSST